MTITRPRQKWDFWSDTYFDKKFGSEALDISKRWRANLKVPLYMDEYESIDQEEEENKNINHAKLILMQSVGSQLSLCVQLVLRRVCVTS